MSAIFLILNQPLDALLPLNCIVNLLESLEIDKAIKVVSGGESRAGSSLVFPHSADEIVSDANVQSLRTVRHYTNKVHRSFAWWLPAALEHAGLRMTNQETHVSDG
jgi:hypothetical protein